MKNKNQKRRNRNKRVLGSMVGWRSKERPLCRKWIVAQGLRPRIEKGLWVTFMADCPDGSHTFLTDGYSKQMGRMLREGFWPELLTPEMHERAERAAKEKRDWQMYQRLYS